MPLQNHIHLDLRTNLSGTPDYAPTQTFKINARAYTPTIFMDLRRTRTGKLHRNILRDGAGAVRKLTTWNYIIKLTGADRFTTLAALVSLNGEQGFLCDSLHADTGSDHTSDLRPVIVQVGKISTQASEDPTLQFFLVEIELEDDSI